MMSVVVAGYGVVLYAIILLCMMFERETYAKYFGRFFYHPIKLMVVVVLRCSLQCLFTHNGCSDKITHTLTYTQGW